MSETSSSSALLTPEQKQREEKWKSQLVSLAKENAQLLSQLRSLAKDKSSMNEEHKKQLDQIHRIEHERDQKNVELEKTQVNLQMTKSELEHVTKTGGGGRSGSISNGMSSSGIGGGTESIVELKTIIEDLRNEQEDNQNYTQNLQNDNERLKEQVKKLQQQLKSSEDANQQFQIQIQEHLQKEQQQKHVDPAVNQNDNNNEETQRLIDTLRKEVAEMRSQRDYFMNRDDTQNSKESRDVLELQSWSALLKKLITSLKQVRSQWDADVERDEQSRALSEALASNVGSEETHYILDALSRVSAQVKKSSNQTSQLMQAAVNQQHSVDVDNFTAHLRPAIVEFLRLVHGSFSDSAYLWAMVKKYKQLEKDWSAKEQELLKKKSGWFS